MCLHLHHVRLAKRNGQSKHLSAVWLGELFCMHANCWEGGLGNQTSDASIQQALYRLVQVTNTLYIGHGSWTLVQWAYSGLNNLPSVRENTRQKLPFSSSACRKHSVNLAFCWVCENTHSAMFQRLAELATGHRMKRSVYRVCLICWVFQCCLPNVLFLALVITSICWVLLLLFLCATWITNSIRTA